MRGRPTDANRNVQYTARLTEQEDKMLNDICSSTGLAKSDVIRHALEEYYAKLQWVQKDSAGEQDWETDRISLKRAIFCPYCGIKNRIDLFDESSSSFYERQMGAEILYEFDFDTECVACGRAFQVKGYISEYPVGAFNHESIEICKNEKEDENGEK